MKEQSYKFHFNFKIEIFLPNYFNYTENKMNSIWFKGYSYEVGRNEEYVNVQLDIAYASKHVTDDDIYLLLADELVSGIWEITLNNVGKFNSIIIKSTTPRCAAIIAESAENNGWITRRINCKGKSSLLRMYLSVSEC